MKKFKITKKFKKLPSIFKIPFLISTALIVASLVCISVFGLKLDIDFAGGSVLEIQSSSVELSEEMITDSASEFLPEDTIIVLTNSNKKALIEMKSISDEEHNKIIDKLRLDNTLVKQRTIENAENFSLELEAIKETSIDKDKIQASLRSANLFGYEVELIEEGKVAKITGDKIEDVAVQEELVNPIMVDTSEIEEVSFRNVGALIGNETKKSAIYAVILSLAAIILYLAWSFKDVSKADIGFKSWHYGLAAIITLIHDLIIVLGIFSLLSYYFDISVGTYFLIAILTILGYSVNDTIVVFNRVKDNVLDNKERFLGKSMVLSIKQTARRSINTSLTTLIVLGFLYFIGGEESNVIKYFSLALLIGITVGTYSSIFIANSILYFLHKD